MKQEILKRETLRAWVQHHPNLPMPKEFEEGFIAGGASADDSNWYDAKVMRPNHMQICYCYDKYMGGGRVYVYDDISKYWCSANTEEHDPNGDNHVCDYGDFRVTHWRPNREDKPISE